MQLFLSYHILSFGKEMGMLVKTLSKITLVFKPVLGVNVAGSVQMCRRRREEDQCSVCFAALGKV